MSDNAEQPVDGATPIDPWAPPERRTPQAGAVPLTKNAAPADQPPRAANGPVPPGDGSGAPADAGPPADSGHPGGPPSGVHDQQTVAAMPGIGTGPTPPAGFAPPQPGPADWSAPGTVPAPPVGPNGPGQAVPPAGPHGYPGATAPMDGGPFAAPPYGYPGAPGPQGPPPYPQYGHPAGQLPQYGYPGYPGHGNPWGMPGTQPANGLGIASLVLGIIATAGFCMYGLGIVLGILALIFGIIGRGRARRGEADNGGVALAGIILGSVGIVVGAAFIGFFIWAVNQDFDEGEEEYYEQAPVSLVVQTPQHGPGDHLFGRG
ncbi:DUF4190 domain-containing protein [Streptomyces sp. NBC_00525]|uniref:DUF4190 domain-containing protein n=1 Tax=Streptomyces sp. NBC_00525 TaxID=2903660 RepID=UPI002E822D75|nr:DUF4190 domain-containing protein [Streptomyces sp. NBC_00525]WUC96238.1 DUF4190 domain-containing protein [Streptomyces sp. NBC_00525]